MKRKIDLESLPLKNWKKEAAMFQDDYTAGAGTSWLLNVAKAENKMIWEMIRAIEEAPILTPPNEALTWEELKAETKINPVYSIKYGWIFPSTVKDEPYKQIWFFTSKGFAQTELFYRDTFYRRPPEGEV